jgi:hypothetical protein
MSFRFEFDPVNSILLMRFEGRLTEEALTEVYREIRKYVVATETSAGIWDFSSVTEFAVSSEFIRHIATLEPATTDTTRRRFIVVQNTSAFGLARMFASWGLPRNPLLRVVYTVDEALTTLGVQSPQFEPLE